MNVPRRHHLTVLPAVAAGGARLAVRGARAEPASEPPAHRAGG